MKYLKKFATEADVTMSIRPNAVLVSDTGEVLYNVLKGIGIQHIDGQIYSVSDWIAGGFAAADANGVAVFSPDASFVIAKHDASSKLLKWASDTSAAIDGVFLSADIEAAKLDFNGKTNTEAMLAVDTSGAGDACAKYIFPNGAIGYLPAYGEWRTIAMSYQSLINEALEAINGTPLSGNTYWSSSQYAAHRAWPVYWEVASPSYVYDKSRSYSVRAFTTL